MSKIRIENTADGLTITVKIVPNSSKTALAGLLDAMIKIKVAAPPEKGKANKSLSGFLAKKLGLRKQDITIISGQTSAVKQIQIKGITRQEFLEKLELKD